MAAGESAAVICLPSRGLLFQIDKVGIRRWTESRDRMIVSSKESSAQSMQGSKKSRRGSLEAVSYSSSFT